jgi:hypothetical protein
VRSAPCVPHLPTCMPYPGAVDGGSWLCHTPNTATACVDEPSAAPPARKQNGVRTPAMHQITGLLAGWFRVPPGLRVTAVFGGPRISDVQTAPLEWAYFSVVMWRQAVCASLRSSRVRCSRLRRDASCRHVFESHGVDLDRCTHAALTPVTCNETSGTSSHQRTVVSKQGV